MYNKASGFPFLVIYIFFNDFVKFVIIVSGIAIMLIYLKAQRRTFSLMKVLRHNKTIPFVQNL